ncbi:MAG: radical SAM protein [Candidatus Latescibacteria bacterium]|nr:radical SAM protein [Candidatus Latescibacterota bacterium]
MADISGIFNRVKGGYGRLAKSLHPALTLPPLRVTFEVTYRCNLSCPFCFQEFAREQSPDFKKNFELSNEEILAAVDELPRHTLITFNGGEVFVRKDFPDLLRAIKARGRRCNIVTNGTMLFADKAELLVDQSSVLSAGVSIDGIGETHDLIRRLPGAFERTVENLRGLSAYRRRRGRRFPVVDVKTVITSQNLEQLSEIYLLARDIGADYLTLSCLRTSELLFALPCRSSMADGAWREAPLPLSEPVDLDLLRAQLENLHRLAAAAKPALRFYPDYGEIPGIIKYYANEGTLEDYELCRAPWTNIRVAPNGDVYPCLAYRMGNIREQRLLQIWKGRALDQFRAELDRQLLPACMGCCFLKAKPGITYQAAHTCAQAFLVAQ